MAAKKKPAIANVARPEGFIDDVVLPIAQKAVRASSNRLSRKSANALTARGASRKFAKSLERSTKAKRIGAKRSVMYYDKSDKLMDKSISNYEKGKLDAAARQVGKAKVAEAKGYAAARTPQRSVRGSAQARRAENKNVVRQNKMERVKKLYGKK